MDTPRKNNDCYFYYYSTCRKGDGCLFRHEPSALGCETTCSYWQQGKCLNQHCNFRHMELRKNRKLIPCYWENQPGGCRKPHCPFLHKNARDPVAVLDRDESAGLPSERSPYNENVANSDLGPRRVSNDANFGNPSVDPLVVNFEEESDSESAPTTTPVKTPTVSRRLVVKTLDEIRLEKVQAEQAALFSYKAEESPDLRSWLRRQAQRERTPPEEPGDTVDTIVVKTLEQIRAERAANGSRKRSHSPIVFDEASLAKKSAAVKRTSHPVKLQRNPERWASRMDDCSPKSSVDDTCDETRERLEHPENRHVAPEVNGNCESHASDMPSVNGTSAEQLRNSVELEDELLSDNHADIMNIKADEDILQDIDNLLMD